MLTALQSEAVPPGRQEVRVDFLWVELTNACNLRCVHCYADSGPRAGRSDRLRFDDYVEVIRSAANLGCRAIQFIGGEPTIHRQLAELVTEAAASGYELIEIFTNLTRLQDSLWDVILRERNRVAVATSVYSSRPEIHDGITGRPGSLFATIKNIDHLLAAGLRLRVAYIEMPENEGEFGATSAFLKKRGVEIVTFDNLRAFGRGSPDGSESMSDLCGQCAGGTLCVGADGLVSPCIMSKAWAIGNLLESDLAQIVQGSGLLQRRQQIREATKQVGEAIGSEAPAVQMCNPCAPYSQCGPCPPNTNCPPHHCNPWFGR